MNFFINLPSNQLLILTTMEKILDILISLSLLIGGISLAWLAERKPASKGWRIFLKCLVQLCVIAVIICFFYQKMPLSASASLSQTIDYTFRLIWSSLILFFIGYMVVVPIKTHKRIANLICCESFSDTIKAIIISSFVLSELIFITFAVISICDNENIMQSVGLAAAAAVITFLALIILLLILSWLINLLFLGVKRYWHWLKE